MMLNHAIVITMFVKDRILSYNHSGLHYYRFLLITMILNHAIVITIFVKDRILSYNHSGLHYYRFLLMTITSFCLRKRDFFHLCATHFGNIFDVLMSLSTCGARIYLHFLCFFLFVISKCMLTIPLHTYCMFRFHLWDLLFLILCIFHSFIPVYILRKICVDWH